MKWSEVEGIWRGQKAREAGFVEAAASLRQTFDARSRKWARRLFWRDAREALAGLILAAFIAYRGLRGGGALVASLICVLVTLGLVAFFVRERLRVRRLRLGLDAPLLAKVTADIAEMRHQRRLLLHVTQWYIAPLLGVCMIMLGTDVWAHSHRFFTTAAEVRLAGAVAVIALVFWRVRALNHRAVRRVIEPRIRELEQLRNALLPPE